MTQPPPLPKHAPKPPLPDQPLRRRLYGLELSLGGVAGLAGGTVGIAVWPFLALASLFDGAVFAGITALAVCAIAIAACLDLVLAKTANRQTRGLLFPATSLVAGFSVGFGVVGACVMFIVNVFLGGL